MTVVTAPLKASKVGATNTFPGRAFHRAWEEGFAVHLDASWGDLIFVWVVISCAVRKHWGEVAIVIGGNLLGIDPIHQEEAR